MPIILSTLLLGFYAWAIPIKKTIRNSNTWCIQIDNKDLLIWTKNQIGEEVRLKLKSLKQSNVLHVQRNFCGQTAENSSTTITIKNNFGIIIKEVTNKNNSMMFEADIPVKDFIDQFSIGQTISIYFTISSYVKELNSTVLLGKLKLE